MFQLLLHIRTVRIVACIFEGVVGAICVRSIEMLLWNLCHFKQVHFQTLPKSQEVEPRVPYGGSKIGPRGTHKDGPTVAPRNDSPKGSQK